MTESASTPRYSVKGRILDIGACPESGNARKWLARNWTSGAKRERAPKSRLPSPPPSPTPRLEKFAHSGGSAKRPVRMATEPGVIRILTVDDHALLRKGIAAL